MTGLEIFLIFAIAFVIMFACIITGDLADKYNDAKEERDKVMLTVNRLSAENHELRKREEEVLKQAPVLKIDVRPVTTLESTITLSPYEFSMNYLRDTMLRDMIGEDVRHLLLEKLMFDDGLHKYINYQKSYDPITRCLTIKATINVVKEDSNG